MFSLLGSCHEKMYWNPLACGNLQPYFQRDFLEDTGCHGMPLLGLVEADCSCPPHKGGELESNFELRYCLNLLGTTLKFKSPVSMAL